MDDPLRAALDEFHKTLYRRERRNGRAGSGLGGWRKPIKSDALAVHPRQVDEAVADAKRKGVPTEFLPDGRPLIRSRQHKLAYCRAYGFCER